MKRITKILAVSALLAAMLVTPVLAVDASYGADNTDFIIVQLNNNAAKLNGELNDFIKVQTGPNAEAVIAAQKALVASKIASVNRACAQNHLNNLAGKVYNAKVNEANALSQLNWSKSLAANSASFNGQVETAQRIYDNAVAATAAAEAYLAEAKVKLASYM